MHYFLLVNDFVPVSAILQGTLQLGDRSPAGLTQPCSLCPGTEPLPGNTGAQGVSLLGLKEMGKKGAFPASADR